MIKLAGYLDELKTNILKDFKKQFDEEMEKTLTPLVKEKERLKTLTESRRRELDYQKNIIQKTTEQQKNNQEKEIRKREILSQIWNEAMKIFLRSSRNEWYVFLAGKIPHEKGNLTYNPDKVPAHIIENIKQENENIILSPDQSLPEGFVFESDSVKIELTEKTFSDQQYMAMKEKFYHKLQELHIV